jgi:lipoprotein-anchoring transpeptidase ErfK/SrfK
MNSTLLKKIIIPLVILAMLVGLGFWLSRKPAENIPLAADINLLNGNDIVATTSQASTVVATSSAPQVPMQHYIEIVDSCGPYYDVTPCVNMRSGPGLEYPVVGRLRTGVVLKVEDSLIQSDLAWHKIIFDKEIRYPERVSSGWYVAADEKSVQSLLDIGDEVLSADTPATANRIVVDSVHEILYAYDGDVPFMQESISTGLDFTPTPVGTFKVYKKTPSRYMQGPLPGISDQYYDLPGVPWNLYFTKDGAVVHGAYWHDHFGHPWSHGCVNLTPQSAKKLYLWADLGTTVTVKR